jgi:homopolymeric O-antigen transport system ATP-binding protein
MRPEDRLAIVVRDLGVEYDLRLSRRTTVKRTLSDALSRRKRSVRFWALKDVSFAVKTGEIFGIMGANGAGKTTLMMTLAGTLPPDNGTVTVFGKTMALFGLGQGFDLDVTGRENVYLNAAFLGIPRKVIAEKMDEIIEFSELGDFMEAPLRVYSTGMRIRLAFSIAVNIEPEILLLDEVLGGGVGDAAFKPKSEEKVYELMQRAKAIVVVTHSTNYIKKNCSRAMWLDHGSIAASGHPDDVVEAYLDHTTQRKGAVRRVA